MCHYQDDQIDDELKNGPNEKNILTSDFILFIL